MARMNINVKKTTLFYTDTHFYGGAENQMYLLAKFLDKEKYNVILVCSDFEKLKDWATKFESEGIEVIKLSVLHKHDPRHYFQLKDLVKSRKIDLMHIHVWNPASCRYAFLAAKKYNMPTVITEHDPFELKGLKSSIKQKLIRHVDSIITVSEANKKMMEHLFPAMLDKLTTIHNGIDVTWFESQLLSFSDKKRNEYREKIFNAKENDTVILSVAELHERKGLQYLIKALPEVIEEHPRTILAIAGSGPLRNDLEKMAMREGVMDHVRFLGFQKDIPHIMAASDLFVLPSKKEAFGLVLLEAGIARVPVVASNVGGIPEIIDHEKTGLLIPPENPRKLAESILTIVNDTLKRDQYSENAYKKIKDTFDAKIMAKKTANLYDEVLNKKHA
ncbi:glycosyltransferase [Candidatus Peregrinibacteria bacterium]|nr:glycosyltransferase [Candidatus Peregrinibacteria bacterium]